MELSIPFFGFTNSGVTKAIEYILMGIITISGVYWQKITFVKDKKRETILSIRVGVALIISFISFVGVCVQGIIALGDHRSPISIEEFLLNIVKSIFLFSIFIFKSWLGPIFTTITVLMGLYFLFEYGEFKVWNFVSAFLDWMFESLPEYAETIYVIILFAVATGGTIVDNLDLFQ